MQYLIYDSRAAMGRDLFDCAVFCIEETLKEAIKTAPEYGDYNVISRIKGEKEEVLGYVNRNGKLIETKDLVKEFKKNEL